MGLYLSESTVREFEISCVKLLHKVLIISDYL